MQKWHLDSLIFLKMFEDAVTLGCCLCVTECKKSIIILQLSAGCDLETVRSKGRRMLPFANCIIIVVINKKPTQIGLGLQYNLPNKPFYLKADLSLLKFERRDLKAQSLTVHFLTMQRV